MVVSLLNAVNTCVVRVRLRALQAWPVSARTAHDLLPQAREQLHFSRLHGCKAVIQASAAYVKLLEALAEGN